MILLMILLFHEGSKQVATQKVSFQFLTHFVQVPARCQPSCCRRCKFILRSFFQELQPELPGRGRRVRYELLVQHHEHGLQDGLREGKLERYAEGGEIIPCSPSIYRFAFQYWRKSSSSLASPLVRSWRAWSPTAWAVAPPSWSSASFWERRRLSPSSCRCTRRSWPPGSSSVRNRPCRWCEWKHCCWCPN